MIVLRSFTVPTIFEQCVTANIFVFLFNSFSNSSIFNSPEFLSICHSIIYKEWKFLDRIDTNIQIFNYENLKNSTLSDNTNIKNQFYNIQLTKQDIKLTLAPFYPVVSINSGANFNESTYDIGDLSSTIDNTGESINYFANFSINFRIFDGGKLYRKLKSVKVQKEIYELQFQKIKKQKNYN